MNEKGNPIATVIDAASEFSYAATNMRRSLEQRKPNREEATEFIAALPNYLPEQNSYIHVDEKAEDITHLGSGFYFSAYRFESISGSWVAKIGHPYAPFKGYPSPSTKEHNDLYNEQLQIVNACFQEHLPFLIPSPQQAVYVTLQRRQTTVILQPFVDGILSLKDAALLPDDQKKQLKDEIDAFAMISSDMREGYGLLPDLLNPSNLFIAPQSDGYHLSLVDNECTDKYAPTPLLNGVSKLVFPRRIEKAISFIE